MHRDAPEVTVTLLTGRLFTTTMMALGSRIFLSPAAGIGHEWRSTSDAASLAFIQLARTAPGLWN